MSGTIHSIAAFGDVTGGRGGTILPAHGGPPLSFENDDTESGGSGNNRVLAAADIGASVTYIYDGGRGMAKKVRFT